MAINGGQIRSLLRRIVAFADPALASDDALADNALASHPRAIPVSVITAGATTVARIVLSPSLTVPMIVSSVAVVTDTTAAFNGTNFATVTLVTNDGLGGADTVVGTVDTTAVSFTAKVARQMTLTPANLYIAAGRQVEVVITKGGTGVALGTVSVIPTAYMS